MRMCIGLTSGLACAVILGGLVLGAQERRQRSTVRTEVRSEQRSRSTTEVHRTSAVVGGTVQLAAGTSIGTIEDIVISDQGCIDYVIVVYEDRYVPIPWSVATVRYGERIIMVDIDRDAFEAVPTFTKDEFHMLADVEFTKKVNKSFNVESTRRESRTREAVDKRRGNGQLDRKDDRATPRGKDIDRDRNSDRPAPKGTDRDSKKGELNKENPKKDESKYKSAPKDEKSKDNESDKNGSKDKNGDNEREKKDKDGSQD